MKVLYFSATGNNLYIAKKIGGEYYSIPKLIKEGTFEFEDEQIGIVFPSYFGDVPFMIEQFLNKVKLNSKYIFAIVSYGSLAGSVTPKLIELGNHNQIQFSYINELLMVDNYLPIFDINKQMKNVHKKKIEENLDKILNDIETRKIYIKKHPGGIRHLEALPNKYYEKAKTNFKYDENFNVDDTCNGCKICEKVCPVDNIKVDRKPVFNGNCMQCLACINHCPQIAIRLKREKSKARFINPNITLKEIIDSNN